MHKFFLGIDVGTQGVRVILVDEIGTVISSGARQFVLAPTFREEQSPSVWWEECVSIIDDLIYDLPTEFNKSDVIAVSVTSTSGTVIPLSTNFEPLHDAIMYSDRRSADQGKRIKEIALANVKDGYTGFNASSGISKMLWYIENYSDQVDDIGVWIHASDFIVGKLSGVYTKTDYTNVLKSGYDLENLEWPSYIFEKVGLQKKWMQEVVPSGTIVGKLDTELAKRWGISQIDVVVGITDGCASQMASGAVNPGDWNTTIGTTLVIKGVTQNNVVDPLGQLYSHRHPEGYWMPGGASNTGADWISIDFNDDLDNLNVRATELIPTGVLAWPLKQEGERYPILAPQARAIIPENIPQDELFAANLEGVAFIEKLAYEHIEELSGERVSAVYTAGGGSNSDVWLTIRASVLNVPIYKCKESSGALGAAIMAASNTYYDSLREAAAQMTTKEKEVYPEVSLVEAYRKQYLEFKHKLKQLNYI